jgi:integrase
MKLSQFLQRGKNLWRVSFKEGGKYRQKWFKAKADAQTFMGSLVSEKQTYGDLWLQATDRQRMEMVTAWEAARLGGYSLSEALAFFEAHRAPRASAIDLCQACDEFTSSKKTKGLRERSLYQLTWTIDEFRNSLPPKAKLSDAGVVQIDAFLNNPEWSQRTRKGRLIDLRNFFNWCVKRGYLVKSPAEVVERPIVEVETPTILSIEQCQKLMAYVAERDPGMLGMFSLALFCGLRPESEIRRLSSDLVDLGGGHVTVEPDAKTRRRRLVTIRPNAQAWLEIWKKEGESPWPLNAKRRWVRARKAVLWPWPSDCLRHSFCSYHYAMFGEQETASQAGHSAQQLHQHYRALVTKEQAEAFWAIKPQ